MPRYQFQCTGCDANVFVIDTTDTLDVHAYAQKIRQLSAGVPSPPALTPGDRVLLNSGWHDFALPDDGEPGTATCPECASKVGP